MSEQTDQLPVCTWEFLIRNLFFRSSTWLPDWMPKITKKRHPERLPFLNVIGIIKVPYVLRVEATND